MTDTVLDLADRVWKGEVDIGDVHPVTAMQGGLVEVAPGVAFIPTFGNVSASSTVAGLVLFDCGHSLVAAQAREQLRGWSQARVDTIVFTHGHADHVLGVSEYEREAEASGRQPPRVVAHEAVIRRFDRYRATAGYNTVINARQFQAPGISWPGDYRYPDVTYGRELRLDIGGEVFELHHAMGETDDHTWTWMPSRRVLFSGDLVIWASPNAGNPQKVQRYPAEWARALREMAELDAEVLLPGHGFPVMGRDRVAQILRDTAALLESLVDQTLALMNTGATLDEVVAAVRAPEQLIQRPYLRPVYDEPEYVVRNLWRLYGGWFDGHPAHLKPASEADLAAEVANLAGGLEPLAKRARELMAAGRLDLAGHLAEWVATAYPASGEALHLHAEVLRARADAAGSTISRGIFASAAADAEAAVARLAG